MNFIIKKKIEECLIINYSKFADSRGYFSELYKNSDFQNLIPKFNIKQINFSSSRKNVFRGMHLQIKPKMSKAMMVVKGEATLLAYNMLHKNFDFKKLIKIKSNENDNLIFWAPYYYARGFISHSSQTYIQYFCDGTYSNKGEYNFAFDLSKFNIKNLKLSDKDKYGPAYNEVKKTIQF